MQVKWRAYVSTADNFCSETLDQRPRHENRQRGWCTTFRGMLLLLRMQTQHETFDHAPRHLAELLTGSVARRSCSRSTTWLSHCRGVCLLGAIEKQRGYTKTCLMCWCPVVNECRSQCAHGYRDNPQIERTLSEEEKRRERIEEEKTENKLITRRRKQFSKLTKRE